MSNTNHIFMDELEDSLEQVQIKDVIQPLSPVEDDEEKQLECHARIISFFAHKGGVSKTTNVYHLGCMLAKKYNIRVLMVDADPQQNLTQVCCETAKNDPKWRDHVERGTIFTAIERLHYGMKDGEYIEPANCVKLFPKKTDVGLFLLPGSLDLAKLEPQITFAHNITNPAVFPLFDDIAGGFRHLFIATCAQYNIDFCLVDMGPSIGELNKSLFWSSDYFIIPCSPDSYCKTTIKTMKQTLPIWYNQQKRLAVITEEMNLYLNPDPPKFLGILFSLFQVAGKNKVPIKNSLHWMDVIKQTVTKQLIPVLEKIQMSHEFAPKDATLCEIPHFLSLMPIAQRAFSTVYDIPEDCFTNIDDGKQRPMSKSEIARHKERGKYFERLYSQFAETIIEMINNEMEKELEESNANQSDKEQDIH